MPFVVAGIAGLVTLVAGVWFWSRYWVVKDTPTSKCAAVFVGRNEVVGTAQPDRVLTSPVTGEPCVWFEWLVEQYRETRDSKGNVSGGWHDVGRRSSEAPFWVVDDSGGVLVWPAGAELQVGRTYRDRASESGVPYSLDQLEAMDDYGELPESGAPGEEPRSGILGAIVDLFDGSDDVALGDLSRHWRISEWRIDPGSPVYVLGHAEMRDDVVALQFSRGAGKLLISTGDERSVASGSLGFALLCLVVTGALAGGVGFGLAETGGAVAGGAGFLLVLGSLYLGRLYNRLVRVKQQAATAWSLIDVALRRRHDLLPELVEVARGYATHEAEVVAAIATAEAAPPAAAKLPSDRALAEAAAVNEAERASSRELLALAERYPELEADEVFQDLAARITEQENQVAYARGFYNDAVTVLRDRRQAFPGNLLARYVTTPSWHLFDAHDHETYVPPVTPLPSG